MSEEMMNNEEVTEVTEVKQSRGILGTVMVAAGTLGLGLLGGYIAGKRNKNEVCDCEEELREEEDYEVEYIEDDEEEEDDE